jgi:hypothetical protein
MRHMAFNDLFKIIELHLANCPILLHLSVMRGLFTTLMEGKGTHLVNKLGTRKRNGLEYEDFEAR